MRKPWWTVCVRGRTALMQGSRPSPRQVVANVAGLVYPDGGAAGRDEAVPILVGAGRRDYCEAFRR